MKGSTLDLIYDDDFILRWYRQGDHWINLVFLMYVLMYRDTENGVDTQNAACGRSGIMIRLRIFKYERNETYDEDDEDNLPHGTKVLK